MTDAHDHPNVPHGLVAAALWDCSREQAMGDGDRGGYVSHGLVAGVAIGTSPSNR